MQILSAGIKAQALVSILLVICSSIPSTHPISETCSTLLIKLCYPAMYVFSRYTTKFPFSQITLLESVDYSWAVLNRLFLSSYLQADYLQSSVKNVFTLVSQLPLFNKVCTPEKQNNLKREDTS